MQEIENVVRDYILREFLPGESPEELGAQIDVNANAYPKIAFGHPISEPYWARTKIGGAEQWVLLQLFERRTLTYTPANSPAWQVEMGNVGQHYYTWRYGVYENPPWTR